ncbi:phosphatidylglycerophosphatase A [Aminiphilus sp.]|uniref:phosphatidylglycerophosphatase A family protein n=1 Tax=Aminiphilus sp. TaxID=1872488 RepID=UPI0026323F1C|nr:phosphatidylglycerophosphatase A [Aminiphilus sp.]
MSSSFDNAWCTPLATLGGLGRLTAMPGTVGSVAAFLVALLVPIPLWAIAAVAVVGGIAADVHARRTENPDPPEVVIDEVVGTWIAMFGHSPANALGALFLFRVLDIVKPFPVCTLERLPGGVGIMADDIAAGVGANLILHGLLWLFLRGGFASFFG